MFWNKIVSLGYNLSVSSTVCRLQITKPDKDQKISCLSISPGNLVWFSLIVSGFSQHKGRDGGADAGIVQVTGTQGYLSSRKCSFCLRQDGAQEVLLIPVGCCK